MDRAERIYILAGLQQLDGPDHPSQKLDSLYKMLCQFLLYQIAVAALSRTITSLSVVARFIKHTV